MITRSVTIEDIDHLFLQWHDHINVSALYRQSLREEMDLRDVDPRDLLPLDRTRDDGYTLEELAATTDRFADLQAVVDDQPRQHDPATDEPDGR